MSQRGGHITVIVTVAFFVGLLSLLGLYVLKAPLYCHVTSLLVGYWVHSHLGKKKANSILNKDKAKVCIVGAGFSGLCMGIQLKMAGIDFVIVEKSSDVGGTWHANQYPGIKCDVWSVLYQLSFFKNPNWSGHVSPGREIKSYLQDAVSHFGLKGHIRLNTGLKKATWVEEGSYWTLELDSTREKLVATHLISGCGFLRKPTVPAFKGLENFKGHKFHSAEWDHSYDLKGRNVAVIGSGASGVQIAPEIADKVDQLYVFQRTPNWFFPRIDAEFPDWYKALVSKLPFLMTFNYWATFLMVELTSLTWLRKGATSRWLQNYLKKDVLRQVNGDVELAAKLTPNYEIGCKRILLINDYLPMFVEKPNVHLVTDEIEEITESGIVTKHGQSIGIDLLIFATGFHIEDSICGFEAIGRFGHNLRDYFDSHPAAFNGITVPNFPNFFILMGPNTVLAHNSVLFMIECQVNYIMQCLKQMLEFGIKSVDVKEKRVKEFRWLMDKWSLTRNFTGSCKSWYKNKDGINFILWPSNLIHYWWITSKVHLLKDYWITLEKKDNGA